jgi:hypothetical protein
MKQGLFSFRPHRIGVGGLLTAVIACCVASPAMAATTPVDTSNCSAPVLNQALAPFGDSSWYTMLPGESNDELNAAGWTLSGGASIKTTTVADGSTGTVLDLPSGAQAVSPTICVNNEYPTARTDVRNVTGGEGVQFYVSYGGTKTWTAPKSTGQFHGQQTGWTLSEPVNLQPSGAPGWQLVRFVFVPGGKKSEFQISNFLVDPRCRG